MPDAAGCKRRNKRGQRLTQRDSNSVYSASTYMKFKELTTKTEAEVRQLLGELRLKSHDLSVKLKLNQLKNTKELSVVKRDVAKIMTFLSSKVEKKN